MRRLFALLGALAILPLSISLLASPASAAPKSPACNSFTVRHGAGVWSLPQNTSTGVGTVNPGDVICSDYITSGQTLTFYGYTSEYWFHVPAKNNGFLWVGAVKAP